MSKSSKKRHLPKFSKLGKYFKLKRSSKAKITEQETPEVQNGGQTTPTCVPEYTKILDNLRQEEFEDSTIKPNEDKESIQEQIKSNYCVEETNKYYQTESVVAIDDGQHVADNTGLKPVMHEEEVKTTADVIVHSSVKNSLIQDLATGSERSAFSTSERKVKNSNFIDKTTSETEQDVEEYPEELIYPVVIKTLFHKQNSEIEGEIEVLESSSKDENNGQHVPCTVVVHTPVKKQLINGLGSPSNSIAKASVDDDDDDDDVVVLMEMPKTPPQTKSRNRVNKRVSTVKKIRSIIATPYKRLKRDSNSLMDGHTYRYIEIQSLVNAFQTLHPCKGGMMACNEKGLQYGKSFVLRIECKDCSTKVFLQATKN